MDVYHSGILIVKFARPNCLYFPPPPSRHCYFDIGAMEARCTSLSFFQEQNFVCCVEESGIATNH